MTSNALYTRYNLHKSNMATYTYKDLMIPLLLQKTKFIHYNVSKKFKICSGVLEYPSGHKTLNQCWFNVGQTS